jgi:hypothetical protein
MPPSLSSVGTYALLSQKCLNGRIRSVVTTLNRGDITAQVNGWLRLLGNRGAVSNRCSAIIGTKSFRPIISTKTVYQKAGRG